MPRLSAAFDANLTSKIGSTFFIESDTVYYLSLSNVAILGNFYNITVQHVPFLEIFRNVQVESSLRIQDLFGANSRRAMTAMLGKQITLSKGPFKLDCTLSIDEIRFRFQLTIKEGSVSTFSLQLSIQWHATTIMTVRLEKMIEILFKVFLLPRKTLTILVLGVPVRVTVVPAITIGVDLTAAIDMQLTVPLRNTKVVAVSYTAEDGWSFNDSNQELLSGSWKESQLRMTEGKLQATPYISLNITSLLPLVVLTLELKAYADVQLACKLSPGAGLGLGGPLFAGTVPILADTLSLIYGIRVSTDAQVKFAGSKFGSRPSFPLVDHEIEAITLPTITLQIRGFGCLPDMRRYAHLESVVADGLHNSLLPATSLQWFLNSSNEWLSLDAQGDAGSGAYVIIPPASGGESPQQVDAVLGDVTVFAFGTPSFPGGGFRVVGAFCFASARMQVPQYCAPITSLVAVTMVATLPWALAVAAVTAAAAAAAAA